MVTDDGHLGKGSRLIVYGRHASGRRLYRVSAALAGPGALKSITISPTGLTRTPQAGGVRKLRKDLCVPAGERRALGLRDKGVARGIEVKVVAGRAC